jgi:hypothetical protein
MPVQAQFGVVRKVRAELQKEWAEVAIHAIHIEVVDHRCRRHQPRISRAGLLTPAAFGPQHRRLLLRLADEKHSFGLLEPAQVLAGNIILALAFAKLHHRNLFPLCERLHGCDESLTDRIHECAGNELVSLVIAKESDYPCVPLQLRHVNIQVHPVDSFDLEADMLGQHL